jgi:hypothetical protein
MRIKQEHEATWKTGAAQRKALGEIRGLHNKQRRFDREAEWRRWNDCAAEIWKTRPNLKVSPVAALVKRRLGLSDSERTIRAHLKKAGNTS